MPWLGGGTGTLGDARAAVRCSCANDERNRPDMTQLIGASARSAYLVERSTEARRAVHDVIRDLTDLIRRQRCFARAIFVINKMQACAWVDGVAQIDGIVSLGLLRASSSRAGVIPDYAASTCRNVATSARHPWLGQASRRRSS